MEKRQFVMELHKKAIKNGEFAAARRLYRLLLTGVVYLRLNDVDWTTQTMLEEVGISVRYSRDGLTGRVSLIA